MLPLGVVRVTTLVLGGLVPAFTSFQALERGDLQAQRVLLVYWSVFAVLTAAEVPADVALSWLPLYGEAKLALLLWLLTPRFAGAVVVYRAVLEGWLRRHQAEIERTLRQVQLQDGVWALLGLFRGMLGVVFALAKAAWLITPQSVAQASQRPPALPPPLHHHHQPETCSPTLYPAAEPDGQNPETRPVPGHPAPLDTAPVTLLSAGLEESCAMLLRTALAAQAGNQLLMNLHSQTAGMAPPQPGVRRRHGRRRTVSASAGQSSLRPPPEVTGDERRSREGPSEERSGGVSVFTNPAVVSQSGRR